MGLILNLYPTLTDILFSRIGYMPTDHNFYYKSEGYRYELVSEHADLMSTSSYHIKVSDMKCMWHPSENSLIGERTIDIMNSGLLFGKNGIAGSNAEIGVALRWMCKASDRRGTIKLGSFRKKDNNVNIKANFEFDKGMLSENIILQTILFLKDSGEIELDETSLASDSGVLLGILDEYNIIIEGKGSIFPIVETDNKSGALWWIESNWIDPTIDSFSEENIKIVLNRGHKNYKDLNLDEGIGNSPLFIEILSSALYLIIVKVKESPEWENIIKGENIEPGSIGEAIYYFLTTFEWKDCDSMRLAFCIRNSLYSKFKGA